MLSKLKSFIQKHSQFLRFCLVGASNTLITMGTLYLLFDVLKMDHTLSYILSYTLGVVNGYFWSTRSVFRVKRTSANLMKFVLVNVVTLGLNTLLMWLLVDNLGKSIPFAAAHQGLYAMLAQAVVVPVTFIANFSLNKLWTFSEKTESK